VSYATAARYPDREPFKLPRVERRLAVALDSIGRRPFPHAHDLRELRPGVVDADAVVGGNPRRKAVPDELRVHRPPAVLAVVVRARASREEAEPVAHPLQLRAERVRDARFEPADHPGTPPRQHRPRLPGLAEQAIEAVDAPDREHVRRVATADEDHVLLADELFEVLRGPREEGDIGGRAALGQAPVQIQHGLGVVGDRGRDRTDLRVALPAQLDGVGDEPPRLLLARAAAADSEDVPLRHAREFTDVPRR
jgi:hypothetical protein